MRAALIEGPGRARVVDVPAPEPGPGEVRVRLAGCGVCGSSLPAWEGRPWFSYPLAPGEPGHEGWGTVDATGPGTEGLAPGRRVALQSFRAFAEFDVAPAASVVAIPGALDGEPFPGEALGCAVNALRRGEVTAGQTVAVVGAGFLGALIAGLAAGQGARVTAASRRRTSLESARRMGAERLVQTSGDLDRDVAEAVRHNPEGFDRVFEVTGLQAPLDLASRLVRERGRLVIAGFHQDGPRLVDMQLWNWRGLEVVNAHERAPSAYAQGMRGAAEAVAGGAIDPSPLYTHTFPLEELGSAFECLARRPDGFMKALVVP